MKQIKIELVTEVTDTLELMTKAWRYSMDPMNQS